MLLFALLICSRPFWKRIEKIKGHSDPATPVSATKKKGSEGKRKIEHLCRVCRMCLPYYKNRVIKCD